MASLATITGKTLVNLSGAAIQGARRAPRRLRYATAARGLLSGAYKAVADTTEAEIVVAVERIARNEWPFVQVNHVESLMRAPDALGPVVTDPVAFLVDGVHALFSHARLGSASEEEARALVLGGDLFGRAQLPITVEERVMRLVEALVAAAAELRATDDAAVGKLFTTLTPTTLEFTNKFIMRYGYEHGLRLELRMSHLMSEITFISGLTPILQLRIPTILAKQLASGPDAMLLGRLLAIIAQFKSITITDALSAGNIKIVTDAAGVVTGVKGSEIARQAISDALRFLPWGSRTPESNLAPWLGMAAPTDAATLAKWRNVSPNSVFFVDYQRIHNFLLARIGESFARTGLTQIDALTDVHGSERLCRFIGDIFDNRPIVKSMPEADFSRAISNSMDERLILMEEQIGEKLVHPDVVNAVGHELGVRVIGTHQDEIIAEVFEDLDLIRPGSL